MTMGVYKGLDMIAPTTVSARLVVAGVVDCCNFMHHSVSGNKTTYTNTYTNHDVFIVLQKIPG